MSNLMHQRARSRVNHVQVSLQRQIADLRQLVFDLDEAQAHLPEHGGQIRSLSERMRELAELATALEADLVRANDDLRAHRRFDRATA